MTIPYPLSAETRAQLAFDLNRNLHRMLLLEWQLRGAHWNTRGAWFYARHELFENIDTAIRGQADTMAERIGALGHAVQMEPDHVLHRVLPSLPAGLCPGEAFLEHLTGSMVATTNSLRASIELSRTLGDAVSEDILTETVRVMEKQTWFLRRHLAPGTTEAASPPPLPGRGANAGRPAATVPLSLTAH